MKLISSQNFQITINLISNLVTVLVSFFIGFFLSPFIVENLGVEANGYIELVNSFILYGTLLVVIINSMASRFVSLKYHQNKIQKANKYYTATIVGNIAIVLVLLIPAILIVLNLENLIVVSANVVTDVKILFSFVFANFLITQILSFFNSVIYVTNKLYIYNIISLLKTICNAILLFVVFSLFTPKMFFVSLVTIILTIALLPIYLIIKNRIMPELKFNIKYFDIRYLYNLIASGIWNAIIQCGNILMTGLDLLLANLFIDPINMGILAISKLFPNAIIQLGVIVNNNFLPTFTKEYAQNAKQQLLRQLHISMKLSTIIMTIPVIVFTVLGVEFYKLWMPNLDPCILTLLSFLSCFSFVLFSGTQVLNNIFLIVNKLKLNAITVLISGFINVVSVYFLLKYTSLGIIAIAGVSTLIIVLRNLVFTVPYVAKLLDLKWYIFYKDVFISLICCCVVFAVTTLINIIIVANTWILLLVAVVISVAISLILELIILLNKQERIVLLDKLKGIIINE